MSRKLREYQSDLRMIRTIGDHGDLTTHFWDMSTVIARIWTSEGFVIGADGRQLDGERKLPINGYFQKIFWIQEADKWLTYAIAGIAELTDKHGAVFFRYRDAIEDAVKELSGSRFKSLYDYGEHIRMFISDALNRAIQTANDELTKTEQLTRIFLDGYLRGRFRLAYIDIHYDEEAPASHMFIDPTSCGIPSGSIYDPVLEGIRQPNSPLFQFRSPVWDKRHDMRTLDDCIELTKSLVVAHCSPEALAIDPDCISMGGPPHICTVTRDDGIQWVPGFEPPNFLGTQI